MTNYVYNPHGKPVEDLPIIFGFNNGSGMGGVIGQLIAEDGTTLGSHSSSDEDWLRYDLAVEDSSASNNRRHLDFKQHYPDGYRMEFVRNVEVTRTPKLLAAFALHEAKHPDDEGTNTSIKATLQVPKHDPNRFDVV